MKPKDTPCSNKPTTMFQSPSIQLSTAQDPATTHPATAIPPQTTTSLDLSQTIFFSTFTQTGSLPTDLVIDPGFPGASVPSSGSLGGGETGASGGGADATGSVDGGVVTTGTQTGSRTGSQTGRVTLAEVGTVKSAGSRGGVKVAMGVVGLAVVLAVL